MQLPREQTSSISLSDFLTWIQFLAETCHTARHIAQCLILALRVRKTPLSANKERGCVLSLYSTGFGRAPSTSIRIFPANHAFSQHNGPRENFAVLYVETRSGSLA